MRQDLLEKFASCLHIKCLSDLHGIRMEAILYVISEVSVEGYPLDEWNYALTYVFGIKTEITDYKQLTKEYLEQQLNL